MLLTRKTVSVGGASSSALVASLSRGVTRAIPTMDRRAFLRRSGLGVGAGLAASQLTLVKKAEAADGAKAGGDKVVEVKRTVCGHCSVGCAVDAVVENGVWVRQEPVFDSPINLGAHCAKGAAVRENGHGEFRLKSPMKLVGGKYQKISWDQALDEISARMLELRKASGPDSVFVVGSSKHNNEQAYLLRKWMTLWGSNNCDHQARICHSTTVAGVANTWGYGAMTNSYNDMQNSKCALYIGSNAAEAHPVSLLHMLHAKENGCKMIVVDPRFTRTAAKADEFVRLRSGTDIPFLFGVLYHVFKNGWEDKKYVEDRVFGMEKVREDVLAKWTPDKVQEACGVDEATCFKVAKMMAENRPSTIVWCMGQTQHTIGNAMVRASCILQLALGNIGKSGRRRQHLPRPRQRAGRHRRRPEPRLAARLLRHRRRLVQALRQAPGGRLRVDQEAVRAGHDGKVGHHGVALDRRRAREERTDRPGPERQGHDLLGPRAELADPRPRDEKGDGQARSAGRDRSVSVGDSRDGCHAGQERGRQPEPGRLPAAGATQFETSGSCTAIEPVAAVAREGHRAAVESMPDHMIM
jgi:hypothetical protein